MHLIHRPIVAATFDRVYACTLQFIEGVNTFHCTNVNCMQYNNKKLAFEHCYPLPKVFTLLKLLAAQVLMLVKGQCLFL